MVWLTLCSLFIHMVLHCWDWCARLREPAVFTITECSECEYSTLDSQSLLRDILVISKMFLIKAVPLLLIHVFR